MVVTQLILAAKAALTDPVLLDGVTSVLTLNKAGRLRASVKFGSYPLVTGNLAAVNDVVYTDVNDAESLILNVKNTGTAALAAGAFIFEASGNSSNGIDGDWVQVNAARSNANVQEFTVTNPGTAAGTNQSNSWKLSVLGYSWFRVRCTTAVTASSIATWSVYRSAGPVESNPVIPTHAVTGSGTFATTQSGAWAVSQTGGPWTVSQSGVWTVTGSGTFNTQPVAPSAYALTTTAAAIAASVKASAGQMHEITVFNSSAATIYLKFYNKASAPAPASDVPIHVEPIAAGAAFRWEFGPIGKRFATGIALGITGGVANTDTTAIAAGVLVSASYL